MNRLKDKAVAIIGASGGMGQAVAKALAAEGARLALGSRSEQALAELTACLVRNGAEAVCKALDVTSEQEVQAFFDMASQAFGHLDVLLNLAGLSIPASIAEMSVEQYEQSIDVNLKGTFLCSKHFIPLVNTEHGALIVNIGSMAAKRANSGAPLYCTAKAAVNMFSQGLALQLVEKNIRVTTLNPGATDSGFWGTRPVARDKFMTTTDVAEMLMFVLQMNPRVVVHEINFESFAVFK
ncbi:NAD(P)-dependent dehydrogenase (short-subunit alcohol dehydrogenase family) [Paenibacillus sp. V4I3]|uniref:SDR family oxidoreductase n=1 Tax=unclassified Paenibacillus TaxID=185978 RepID=UPI002785A943|nr:MULTISPECIES: SDR family oxidoreductase [unclassified Paenibacillus]MDQ0873662.1 NAD(P)-dependent dehydrogenase (short-subunit alcohol dehydrogenase family) [Paenibacillus sp. V4I3]MDQ0890406.1 NAD(P)-dependent dehydrogenase (short-subunit alcohol dehydrogenase family) [Paenibacillus sp. V4I9]